MRTAKNLHWAVSRRVLDRKFSLLLPAGKTKWNKLSKDLHKSGDSKINFRVSQSLLRCFVSVPDPNPKESENKGNEEKKETNQKLSEEEEKKKKEKEEKKKGNKKDLSVQMDEIQFDPVTGRIKRKNELAGADSIPKPTTFVGKTVAAVETGFNWTVVIGSWIVAGYVFYNLYQLLFPSEGKDAENVLTQSFIDLCQTPLANQLGGLKKMEEKLLDVKQFKKGGYLRTAIQYRVQTRVGPATVYTEMRHLRHGRLQYTYLILEVPGHQTFYLIDNRREDEPEPA